MNKNDLYIEYARVIEMCKGTSFEHKPWVCVKIYDVFDSHPQFTQIPECYQFAIAILEDLAVFVGDILYLKSSGLEYVVDKYTTASAVSDMTWQPPKPKRTFVLNGVELPCPVDWRESSNGDVAVIDGEIFWFKNKIDADLVRDTLSKIFREARDKTMTQIQWTKCSERMPPDEKIRVIVRIYGRIIVDHGKWFTKYKTTLIVDGAEWTPYTDEAWKELNK